MENFYDEILPFVFMAFTVLFFVFIFVFKGKVRLEMLFVYGFAFFALISMVYPIFTKQGNNWITVLYAICVVVICWLVGLCLIKKEENN